MFDDQLRRLIAGPMGAVARWLPASLRANWVTLAGGLVAFAGLILIGRGLYLWGLGAIVANRLLDGLDGAVARRTAPTELGAYLDAVFDTLFFASVPFAFALADPSRAVAASFLIFGSMGAGASAWIYMAFACRAGMVTMPVASVAESLVMVAGFAIACVFPVWFSFVAYGLGFVAFVAAGVRIAAAVNTFE
ncbi:MAG TPA: CDP-alcohol phosphatidyltransferase family protein [Rhizomicrobium sp.]|jgi:phosphatidylglycerophosphate synthase